MKKTPYPKIIINKEPYLNTNLNFGLNKEEIQKRHSLFGMNLISSAKKISLLKIFLSRFKDLLIILLLIATVASLVIALQSGFEKNFDFANNQDLIIEFVQPFIIFAVVIANASLGTWQELKSIAAVAALRSNENEKAKVIREGKLLTIKASHITIGDLLFIEAGDKIHADGIIKKSNNLFCIEAPLTGESLPVEKGLHLEQRKNAALGDLKHHVFKGCSVSRGNALILVTKISYETEIGKIANLLAKQENLLTPLQLKLNRLSRFLGYCGIALFLIVFVAQVALLGFENIKDSWSVALVAGIALAVAVIPEGLSAFTTIVLAIGVSQMAKQKAIIKHLAAVETLGSASVISSDKTGTITQNKMSVSGIWTLRAEEGLDNWSREHQKLLQEALLCTEAEIESHQDEDHYTGDPTELAIVQFALLHDLRKSKLKLSYPRVNQIPFDSQRKMMSVLNEHKDDLILITKGAPEKIMAQCHNLNDEDKSLIEAQLLIYGKQAFRTLAVAKKTFSQNDEALINKNNWEKDLTFLGLIAMEDPARPESKEAIKLIWEAGIKPIMITGDHPLTAAAIAQKVGIIRSSKDKVISSQELKKLSDQELSEKIENYAVYARVSPEDKIRVVKAWQAKDQVIAMTGDGVNDAPALKAADLGCAMGISGTDVSKDSADIILVDDNYYTIVKAVETGRHIYEKLRKVILNLLVMSTSATLSVVIGLLVFNLVYHNEIEMYLTKNHETFNLFSAIQILWLNLIVHGLPAIALGLEEDKNNLMQQRPFSKHESIFSRGIGWKLIWQGMLITILTLGAYAYGMQLALQTQNFKELNHFGATAGFLTLSLSTAINAFNLFSDKSVIFVFNGKRKYLYLAVGSSVVAILLVVLIPPIADVFSLVHDLTNGNKINLFWVPLLLALVPTLVWEIFKLWKWRFKMMHFEPIRDFQLIKKPQTWISKLKRPKKTS